MEEGVQIGNLQIPIAKGEKGDKGDAGKIVGLSIIMLDSTATPTVTNTGTQTEANYTIGIPKGTGISTATINNDGELILTLTDGTELNLGIVMPNSIASVSMSEDYDFVVTLTDGTETTVGNLAEEMESVINTALANYYTKSQTDSAILALGNFLLPTIGRYINLSINPSTYVLTATLSNNTNTAISTSSIDLPLESMVVSGTYNNATKKVILTLQSGSTVEFSVADLVSGLQSEITSSNKLLSDLVDDTNQTNKFLTSSEKLQIATNQTDISNIKDGTLIDSFGDVETALGGKEDKANKVTELDNSDEHYPTTHAVKTVTDNITAVNNQQNLLLDALYQIAPKTDYVEGSDITLENTLKYKLEFEDDIIAHGDMYQGNLPDTYQQVEYIESDGNQYINTGAKITDNNLKIDTKIYTSDIPTTEQDIIGSYTGNGSRLALGFSNKTVFLYTNNSSETQVGNVSTSAFSGSQTLEITAEIDYDNSERQLIVNGTEYSSNDVRVVTNSVSNIILFKREATGNSKQFIGKMYYLKLYINHKLKFDFVPCYRKSDNEIGLYDMVSNTFFTNDGTGNFTKGADISLPIERPIEFVTGTQTVQILDANNTVIVTKNLSLGNKKMFEDGYISRESNNWYFNDYYTEYVVTGNENWSLNSSGVRIDLYNITTNSKGTTNQYCNYVKTCQEYAPNSNTFFVGGTSIRIYNDWGFQTNAQIISKFTELYNNGKPLRFVYELNQPIKTPITDTTLIEQLEEISNIMSVNGTTKIQITGNLPMKMKVRALKNLSINSIDDRLSLVEE